MLVVQSSIGFCRGLATWACLGFKWKPTVCVLFAYFRFADLKPWVFWCDSMKEISMLGVSNVIAQFAKLCSCSPPKQRAVAVATAAVIGGVVATLGVRRSSGRVLVP